MSQDIKTEETTETPKKKGSGRKTVADGGTSSPRKTYVICSSIINGELIQESITTSLPVSAGADAILNEAKGLFTDKYGIAPQCMSDPYFKCEFVLASGKKKDCEVLDIDLDSLQYLPDHGVAIFKDWNVTVRLIGNLPDCACIYHKTRVDGIQKTNKPSPKVVKLSALKNLKLEL